MSGCCYVKGCTGKRTHLVSIPPLVLVCANHAAEIEANPTAWFNSALNRYSVKP